MSSAALSEPFPPAPIANPQDGVAGNPAQAAPAAEPVAHAASARIMRRRPDYSQGRALEQLGHAVEYLIDSRLYLTEGWDRGEQEAVQILMQASRGVFAECAERPEPVPLKVRVGRGLRGLLAGRPREHSEAR